ncbi:MAG: EamA family transporter RarD [Bifidobacteriaceae bacterium]|nr:EamA family transporter RarD [Bifidobacteriaceae bacterium]
MPDPRDRPKPGRRTGPALGVGAYFLWGLLPLYLLLAEPAGALEVIAHRLIWSAVMLLVIVAATGQFASLWRAFANLRALGALSLAGVLLTVNWLVFVWAIYHGQLVNAALGYFINPLVSVLLGVVLLGERLRAVQWAAVGVGAVAVVAVGFGVGSFPAVALALAFSFGFYGYIEKRVGGGVSAVTSLSVETLVMVPFGLAYAVALGTRGEAAFGANGPWHALIMVGLGAVTLAPLLLFNGAARRLPLSVLGLIQYFCPVMQFITGVVFLHESMPPVRWAGFGLVWVALIVLSADAVWRSRRSASRRRVPASP